jgi:uncharacterized ion transporter superfamily protein YfcC
MKKHNTIKVVLITILVLMLLTWILPAAYYSSGYVDQGRVQMGLFDLISYPITAISYFGYIAVFALVVGAFYGVLNKIDAYRSILDKLSNKFAQKGKLFLAIVVVLIAVLTSFAGLQIGLFVFFPMLVSIILLMGYDKMTAALTLVGSTMIGIMGSTFAYGNTSIIISTLKTNIASHLLTKIIILVVGLAILMYFTFKRLGGNTKKVVKKVEVKKVETKPEVKVVSKTVTKTNAKKASKKKSKSSRNTRAAVKEDDMIMAKADNDVSNYVPAAVEGPSHNAVPLVIFLIAIFVILVLSFIQWSNAFKITAFENATTAVTGFKIFGFALFGKLLGTVSAFGSWTLTSISTVLIFSTLLLALIYKVKLDDMFDGVAEGAKKAIKPAILIVLIYTCLVIVTYHPFQLVIYKALLGLTKGFNVFTGSIVAILASVFNADPAYAFQSVLPYLASIYTKTATYPVIAIVFQSIYGLTMLVAPTSVVLMCVLSYLDISYKDWLKNIWKLVVLLLIILLIIFAILMAI